MTDRPAISFRTPSGLMITFGFSTAIWTILVCAVVVLASPDPKAFLPGGIRHIGHELRLEMAQAYAPHQG